MSALKSVQLAIELATRDRDELAKVVARVERSLAFAHNQMAQLEGYAAETEALDGLGHAQCVSTELMRHHYQFMDRLQQAISMQSGAWRIRRASWSKPRPTCCTRNSGFRV